jgi:alkylation response protein AidB-like acyl-CoA dehydrogenase
MDFEFTDEQKLFAESVRRFALGCNLTGFEVAHESVQIMEALGYSRDTLFEYCMRRTRGWMIAGGSVEILKNRIAEHIRPTPAPC